MNEYVCWPLVLFSGAGGGSMVAKNPNLTLGNTVALSDCEYE